MSLDRYLAGQSIDTGVPTLPIRSGKGIIKQRYDVPLGRHFFHPRSIAGIELTRYNRLFSQLAHQRLPNQRLTLTQRQPGVGVHSRLIRLAITHIEVSDLVGLVDMKRTPLPRRYPRPAATG